MKKKYDHDKEIHDLEAPRKIAPVVTKMIKPKSVLDVGCGQGNFLKAFKECGVREIHGLDGEWCNKTLLFNHIQEDEFTEVDLEVPIQLDKLYDMVICLEVAEHLSADRAEGLVDDLTRHGKVILFSAAIPGQGGTFHINEQWLSYWKEKFEKRNFVMKDVLRPIFWQEEGVFWWYKQNMVLFIHQDNLSGFDLPVQEMPVQDIVHPELYNVILNPADRNAYKRYLKLLGKSIRHKLSR